MVIRPAIINRGVPRNKSQIAKYLTYILLLVFAINIGITLCSNYWTPDPYLVLSECKPQDFTVMHHNL